MERNHYSDNECSTTDHEELPFALEKEKHVSQHSVTVPSTYNHASVFSSSSLSSQGPPALEASFISNTDGESQASTEFASSSLLQPCSQYLDAAASLLLPSSSLQESSSSSLRHSTTSSRGPHDDDNNESATAAGTATTSVRSGHSVGFSQLLQEADDTNPNPAAATANFNDSRRRLPVLPEEHSVASYNSSTSTRSGDHHHGNVTKSPRLLPRRLPGSMLLTAPQQHALSYSTSQENNMESISLSQSTAALSRTIVPAAVSTGPDRSIHRSEERRLAHLAGATANRTSDSSFVVTIELSSTAGTAAGASVRDVMDVVGNPDWLPLWCDPIPGNGFLVVTSCEGAQQRQQRRRGGNEQACGGPEANREYDGEWIEATTAQLMAPHNSMNWWYSTSRSISAALGFPTYGRITMFVERQRGQVGLTIGTFPGNLEVSHKICIQEEGPKIRIVDQVRVQRDSSSDDSDGVSFCGIRDAMERCFLPSLDDYMDQVLSSMARLRFLVENGETFTGEDTASTPLLGCV